MTRRTRARTSPREKTRPVARAPRAVERPSAPARVRSGKTTPLRSAAILTMVAGLIATVALPAYAAWQPEEEPQTLQQMSADDAQTLVVASDVSGMQLERSSYAATTAEEIEKKKAAEAAAERARARAAATPVTTLSSVDLSMTAPGSGEVRWPLSGYRLGRGLGDSGYHQGVDLLAGCGTPLFAAAGGVVRVSQESFGGYGVAVTIDHVINGQRVSTLYGHMTYGSRVVQSGQTVAPGQLIGVVGSTGSSTACHLHFEVHVNGSVVDPYGWLQVNAS
ncbi:MULTISPECIES: M23 family metallopeptidase [Microbacterium]|uniref:M23 family metallopeptidase n=1 Tax=Microbacterium wangchenii TaxID=2541726 RepID=A0ABX5SXF7_9MICO|nr:MULTISPECIES: M23 family metallopeptidase [Microbacterium]MCK6067566.1 M23 family metallopeptidase [Microbacterium sp. EYE_512]QBR89509.1 M23 family metallopeptidase [Microbacterium wangchenii]TFV80857.1 M23 family metallopeptidase [Microbacterium sp. dk485]TXK16893.1 M23 family metallopeptidase [Microbacterium wangchenii]